MKFDGKSRGRRAVAVLALGIFLVSAIDLGLLTTTAAADSARDELTKAEDYFLVADFETALEKVDRLLASGDASGHALRDAHVLKARCELGLARRATAEASFCDALRVDPQWRPDAVLYTTDEIQAFEKAQESCFEGWSKGSTRDSASSGQTRSPMPPPSARDDRPWYKKPVFLVAGGVIVAGLVFLLASGGDDDPPPPDNLADFPDPPPTS